MSIQQTQVFDDLDIAYPWFLLGFDRMSRWLNETDPVHYEDDINHLISFYKDNEQFQEGVNKTFLAFFMRNLLYYYPEKITLSEQGYGNLLNFSKKFNSILNDANNNKLSEFLTKINLVDNKHHPVDHKCEETSTGF